MNEGVFPSRKTSTLPGMEEERRLAFVAMTRAQKRLFLTEAEGWTPDGSPRWPSRFLLDIDPALLDFTAPPREELLREARAFIALRSRRLTEQAPEPFPPGRRVRHAVFGSGTVLETDLEKGAHLVRFDGLSTPRSISFRAKLEPED